ncbi:MAG: 6-oxopurine nucleoside phosphorylase, partial [Candidatus Altiarchaeota archaeon]
LRQHILSIARKNRIKLHDKGVYVQTAGPRLETKAEINVIKKWGDVVGMTMASEAILAQERGLAYAAVCTVDNYAHGISKEILDFKRVMEEAASHSKKAVDFVVKAAEGLG